jgi:hypothetical protein
MFRTVFGAACALFLTAVTPLGAQDASQVVVVREGQRVELGHVKAVRYASAEGEVEIRLLFASATPEGVVLADSFGRDTVARWVRSSGAIAVKVSFEEQSPEQYSMTAYVGDSTLSGGGTVSGGDRRGVFKALDLGEDRIAGELEHEMGSVALSGTFRATLAGAAEAPAVTAASVAASPQARVLLEFARAMRRMDFEAAQQHAAGDVRAEMEEAKEMLGEEVVKDMIEERFGDPVALEQRLGSAEASLRETGDSAVISLVKKTVHEDGHSTETESYRFVKVGDAWKITM